MTGKTSDLENVVDVFYLQMCVDHLNGTSTRISKIGNLRISPFVVFKYVLAVPDLNVHLVSIHKLARDSRIGVLLMNIVFICVIFRICKYV